jgi:hypothetical protein
MTGSRARKFKKMCKKVWHFIWVDDSWTSWLVNIILAFLIIKFLIYPGLGLVLHTSHPIVAVVSSSMEHDGSFDDWWASKAMCAEQESCTQEEYYAALGISREEFRDFKFRNGFNKGDIIILYRTNPEKVKVSDIIVFSANRPDPVIHRVIETTSEDGVYIYKTKGDNNMGSFYFESNITEDNYIGRGVVKVPWLGYIKIWFVKLIHLFVGLF